MKTYKVEVFIRAECKEDAQERIEDIDKDDEIDMIGKITSVRGSDEERETDCKRCPDCGELLDYNHERVFGCHPEEAQK